MPWEEECSIEPHAFIPGTTADPAAGSVAMLDIGANANVSTRTIQQPIIGYALTNARLMADLSIDGTQFTRLDL